MNQSSTIVFVCEHGAAKSIVAAAYFDQLARGLGKNFRVLSRGTNPDSELSLQSIIGLAKDGLAPLELKPQRLTESDLQSARYVIAFCELPLEYQHSNLQSWNDVPPVSENYRQARDVILTHIYQLLKALG